MRKEPLFLSWIVRCNSANEASRLLCWLPAKIDLDNVLEDVRTAYPGGQEMRTVRQHRLGDYFTAIRLLPAADEGSSAFRILFQRRPDAPRFWKDLMVRTLKTTQVESPTAYIDIDYKGDDCPVPAAEASS